MATLCRCSYGQHLPSSGDLATEPPLLPPQANLTPLDLGLTPSDPWLEVRRSFHTSCELLELDALLWVCICTPKR